MFAFVYFWSEHIGTAALLSTCILVLWHIIAAILPPSKDVTDRRISEIATVYKSGLCMLLLFIQGK